jgi:S1-C subfamily serine protease
VASFLTGLAGTVCVGIVTGVVAIVLGVVAVARLRSGRERGIGFAATGVLLGVFDVILWGAALVVWLSPGPGAAPADSSDDLEVDLAAFAQLDPPLRRAMLANVLIRVHSGGLLGGDGMGSGVILQLDPQSAWILTNRHVVDPDYSDRTATGAPPGTLRGTIEVKLVGQPLQPGQVIWTAPEGIDLAVVQTNVVPVPDAPARPAEADWESSTEPRIGDEVFAVGNPQGLGWTHTQGTVSQFRTQPKGNRQVRLVQTSTAINPGNSGGGLYDAAGRLIGINTATIDKRVADGLSFAIDFKTFLSFRVPFLRRAAGAPAAAP